MAEALIGGLLAAGACEPAFICATDPVAARRDALKSRFGIRVGDENAKAVREADLVVLAVKPQAMPAVLSDAGQACAGKLVVSIAAGVTTAWIRERIVRLKSQSLTHISKDKPSAKKPQVLQTPPPV